MPITNTGCWTKNWDGIKRIWATRTKAAGSITFSDASTTKGAYNITIPNVTPMSSIYSGSGFSTDNITLLLGGEESASTPSDTDYNIYGPITSGITYVNATGGSISYKASTGIASRDYSVTIQNVSGSALIVYEWGLFAGIRYYSSSSQQTVKGALLYRGKLSEAVTLAQYETITISFIVQMQLDVPNA